MPDLILTQIIDLGTFMTTVSNCDLCSFMTSFQHFRAFGPQTTDLGSSWPEQQIQQQKQKQHEQQQPQLKQQQRNNFNELWHN